MGHGEKKVGNHCHRGRQNCVKIRTHSGAGPSEAFNYSFLNHRTFSGRKRTTLRILCQASKPRRGFSTAYLRKPWRATAGTSAARSLFLADLLLQFFEHDGGRLKQTKGRFGRRKAFPFASNDPEGTLLLRRFTEVMRRAAYNNLPIPPTSALPLHPVYKPQVIKQWLQRMREQRGPIKKKTSLQRLSNYGKGRRPNFLHN